MCVQWDTLKNAANGRTKEIDFRLLECDIKLEIAVFTVFPSPKKMKNKKISKPLPNIKQLTKTKSKNICWNANNAWKDKFKKEKNIFCNKTQNKFMLCVYKKNLRDFLLCFCGQNSKLELLRKYTIWKWTIFGNIFIFSLSPFNFLKTRDEHVEKTKIEQTAEALAHILCFFFFKCWQRFYFLIH